MKWIIHLADAEMSGVWVYAEDWIVEDGRLIFRDKEQKRVAAFNQLQWVWAEVESSEPASQV